MNSHRGPGWKSFCVCQVPVHFVVVTPRPGAGVFFGQGSHFHPVVVSDIFFILPPILREMMKFDEHWRAYVSNRWFNHQIVFYLHRFLFVDLDRSINAHWDCLCISWKHPAGQLEVVMQRVQLGGFFEYKLRCLLELSIWESTTVKLHMMMFFQYAPGSTIMAIPGGKNMPWMSPYISCILLTKSWGISIASCASSQERVGSPENKWLVMQCLDFCSFFHPGEGHFQVNQPLVVSWALCIGSYQPSSRQELAMQNNDAYHEFCLFQTKPIGSIHGVIYIYVYHTNQPFMYV